MNHTDDDDDAPRLQRLKRALEDGTYDCCAEDIASAILACGDLFEDDDEWLA